MEKIKSLFKKIPLPTTEVKAMLLTVIVVLAIIFALALLITYPVEFIALTILSAITALVLFSVYTIYREILRMLDK